MLPGRQTPLTTDSMNPSTSRLASLCAWQFHSLWMCLEEHILSRLSSADALMPARNRIPAECARIELFTCDPTCAKKAVPMLEMLMVRRRVHSGHQLGQRRVLCGHLDCVGGRWGGRENKSLGERSAFF